MTDPNTPPSGVNRRRAPRIAAPALRAALRPRRPLLPVRLTDCAVVDINRAGIGLVSDALRLRPQQPVELHLAHAGHKYYARGIVGYRHSRGRVTQYGVIFTHVPPELDALIAGLLHEALPLPAEGDAPVAPGTQRRLDMRHPAPGLGVRVRRRRRLGGGRYASGRVVDIGRGGISFISDCMPRALMARVELEIQHDPARFLVRGVVVHYHDSAQGCRYGVAFDAVPPALIRLIDSLGPG